MMMRMIESGGIPALVDNIRKADNDNPRGYYEFEAVKKTKQDSSWLQTAPGNVVKMVYRLLYDLPPQYPYRVVFMRRKMDEILSSQAVMLERSTGKADRSADQQMAMLYDMEIRKIQKWLPQQSNFTTLEVDYGKIISEPKVQIDAINQFLDGGLDTQAMMAVVEPSLHRQRQ
jgi:hypothetical protein